MPCLNLDVDYFKHPRTLRLRAKLGPGAELLPLELWCHCARYQPETGRLEGYTLSEVESACGWSGERGKAARALLDTGFLAQDGDAFTVTGWLEEQGHIAAFKKRGRAAALKRWGDIPKAARAAQREETGPQCVPLFHAMSNATGIAASTALGTAPAIPDTTNSPAFLVVNKSMEGKCESKSMEPQAREEAQSAVRGEFRVRGFTEEPPKPQTAQTKQPAPAGNDEAARVKLKLVACYKSFRGIKSGSGWDAQNFERNFRAAGSLLEAFKGEAKAAARWLCAFGERMDANGLCWTLDTAARHAWDSSGAPPP